ncbi:MAG: hypothetical protein WA775_14455 [Psychroserpens sp.]|uniref:hypothetical protein n=1 Tax=Psychroserpens sp. TaxID=2020870 RepID=UPI003C76779A
MRTELDILNRQLMKLLVFYVPYELFQNLTENEIKLFEENLIFKTIYIYKDKQDIIKYENPILAMDIFGKSKLYEDNTFRLLQLKDNMSKNAFDYVFRKYLNKLDGFNYIVKWLYLNLPSNFSQLAKSDIALFKFQSDSCENHLKELKSLFNSKDTNVPYNLKKILIENKGVFSQVSNSVDDNSEKLTTKRKVNEKPKKLITDHEADIFLLKTIFNVGYSTFIFCKILVITVIITSAFLSIFYKYIK